MGAIAGGNFLWRAVFFEQGDGQIFIDGLPACLAAVGKHIFQRGAQLALDVLAVFAGQVFAHFCNIAIDQVHCKLLSFASG